MYIKKIYFKNMIGNDEAIEISFNNKYYEKDSSRFIKGTIKPKDRSEKYNDALLSVMAVVGKNASYKTSTLLSTENILKLITDFEGYMDSSIWRGIDLKKAFDWIDNKPENTSEELEVELSEYSRKVLKITDEEKILKCIQYFFDDNAFDKTSNLEFKIIFVENNEELIVEGKIYQKNEKVVSYTFKVNGVNIDLKVDKFSKFKNYKTNFASFEHYNKHGDHTRLHNNKYLNDSFSYLYFNRFQKDEKRLIEFLKVLDPTVEDIKYSEQKNKDSITITGITRIKNGIKSVIQIDDLSSGTKVFITYLHLTLKSDFIIIDELEQSLHMKLVDLLIEIARENGKQMLFSTHSPLVIDKFIQNYELLIFQTNSDGELNIVRGSKLYRDRESFVNKYLNDLVSNILDTDMDLLRMEFYD